MKYDTSLVGVLLLFFTERFDRGSSTTVERPRAILIEETENAGEETHASVDHGYCGHYDCYDFGFGMSYALLQYGFLMDCLKLWIANACLGYLEICVCSFLPLRKSILPARNSLMKKTNIVTSTPLNPRGDH